jgi:2-haloalkanoic acid dehalogenase type II
VSDAPSFEAGAIRAVAFDAYGTLFRFSDHEHRLLVAALLVEQGLEVEIDAFAESLKKSFQQVSPWAVEGHRREDGSLDRDYMLNGPVPGWISTWEIWRRQFAHSFEEYALAGDATAAANRQRCVLSESEAYPEAHDAIEAIASSGLLVGLLSNADEDFLQSAISRARLRFSVIQSSESLRAYKPNRAVFQALCDRLHCAPAEVLYVGDSPQADVHGARHAGLRTAWVRRSESMEYPDDIPRPDIEVTSLREVAAALGAA